MDDDKQRKARAGGTGGGIFALLQVLTQYPDKQRLADTKVTLTPPPASVAMTTPWAMSEKA